LLVDHPSIVALQERPRGRYTSRGHVPLSWRTTCCRSRRASVPSPVRRSSDGTMLVRKQR
jgi:hypothetical protein